MPDSSAVSRCEAHVEDRLRLLGRELESLYQPLPGGVGILRAADQRDHLVEVVERDQQALEDVGASLGPAQLELRAAGNHLALMSDVVLDHLLERKRLRHPVDQGDHVDPERGLHLGVLVELVEDDHRRVAAPFELDHEPHAGAVRLVAQIGDPVDLLLADQVRDLLDQPPVAALLDHVGELGNDDRVLAALERLDVRLRAHPDRASSRGVGIADPVGAHDRAAAGEVRALDVLHQTLEVDPGIVDVGLDGADRLAQVVRGDVGRHSDRDPGGAVGEQVREPTRERQRLALRLVVVGSEVDGLGLDLAQHLGRQPREAGLRVAHRRWRVVVDRAEVALAVDQRVAQREVLRHTGERVVDRAVAVGVVLAHHLADDERALAVRAVGLQAEIVHRVEHPAMDGLHPVADVGQRPADDHAHRVVEVGRAHLLRERALVDTAGQCVQRAFHLGHRPPRFAVRGPRSGSRHRGTAPPSRASR